MILVDTSIWIDHLHSADERLARFLDDGQVGCHRSVIEELALGSIADRGVVIGLLRNLAQFPVVTHDELLQLVDAHHLWGRGLSAVDAGLLGSVLIRDGSRLWTRDKRLKAAGSDIGVTVIKD
ncbi:MAG: type II toxin-antitoxin system VapC family toxin [Gordonia amarae]